MRSGLRREYGWMKVSQKAFEELVWESIDELPEAIRERIHNLEINVRDAPTEEEIEFGDVEHADELFGLYEGTPLTERASDYALVTPDLITIFKLAHEVECDTMVQLRDEVRKTVRHELAHHFGIDDDRLDELEAY